MATSTEKFKQILNKIFEANQTPAQKSFYNKLTGGSVSGGGSSSSSGGGSSSSSQVASQAAQQSLNQASAQVAEQASAQVAEQASAQVARQAEQVIQNKINAIRDSKEQRIQELQRQNKESGILSSHDSDVRVINARINVEISDLKKSEKAKAGPTGEVQAVGDRTIPQKIESIITTTKTKSPLRKVTERQEVQGGVLESRVVSVGKDNIPNTQIVFVPHQGSERSATQEEVASFRDKQQRVEGIFTTGVLNEVISRVQAKSDIASTRRLRGDSPTGFAGVAEGLFTGGIGAGAAVSLLSTVQFVTSAVTDPVETAVQTKESLIQLSGDITSGKALRDVSTIVKEQPGFVLGFVGTEIITDLATGQIASDIFKSGKRVVTKFSPDFNQITTNLDTGIKSIADVTDVGKLELIPPQGFEPLKTLGGDTLRQIDTSLKDVAAFKGAFGFSAEDIKKLSGKTGPVATSARDLFGFFGPGKTDTLGTLVKTTAQPGFGDISLFGTPFRFEDNIAIAQTRISRLGAEAPTASIFDLLKGDVTFRDAASQIVVFPEETIGKNFLAKQFTPGELEVTVRGERIIKKIDRVGQTIIDKKVVDIVTAEFVDLPTDLAEEVGKLKLGQLTPDAEDVLRSDLIKFSGLDISDADIVSKPVVRVSTFSHGLSILKNLSSGIDLKSLSPSLSPTPSSSIVSPGVSIPSDFSGGSGFSAGEISKILSSSGFSPSGKSGISNIGRHSPGVPTPPVILPKIPRQIRQPKKRGRFSVEVRRGGVFKTIATGSDLNKVLGIGVSRVRSTLAASLRVRGLGKTKVRLPEGFRRKGEILIEKRKRRIKKKRTGSKEVKELKEAKAKKRRSKK